MEIGSAWQTVLLVGVAALTVALFISSWSKIYGGHVHQHLGKGTTATTAVEDTNRPYTLAEVAAHSSPDDAWIIVDGKVYDVTDYVTEHPGGDAILRNVGSDSTEGMHGPQHPPTALDLLDAYLIGKLADE